MWLLANRSENGMKANSNVFKCSHSIRLSQLHYKKVNHRLKAVLKSLPETLQRQRALRREVNFLIYDVLFGLNLYSEESNIKLSSLLNVLVFFFHFKVN